MRRISDTRPDSAQFVTRLMEEYMRETDEGKAVLFGELAIELASYRDAYTGKIPMPKKETSR